MPLIGPNGFFLRGISELVWWVIKMWVSDRMKEEPSPKNRSQIWVHQKHVRWKLNPHLKTCGPFSINFTQKCFDYLKSTCRSFGDWWLRQPTLLTLRTWCSASWDCRPLGSKSIRVKICPTISQAILSWAIHSYIPTYHDNYYIKIYISTC